ncbi:MAG: D-sedoheptulose 7-phosphate isomerase, partial [Arthrobacter pascens]|nr:D-sedoheptulose 7-phosphate isomerase [Arthrobacter pascens]
MTTEWSLQEAELPPLHPLEAGPAALGRLADRPGPDIPVTAASREAVRIHLENVLPALRSLESQADRLAAWGAELARRLLGGQRLLAAGNGGSAAEAQHLTAELVGRYRHERPAYSAISLHAETSSMTAIGNDYGF